MGVGGGGVNLAGKVKNLFLVTIDVYRLENKKKNLSAGSFFFFGGGGVVGLRECQVS